MPTRTRSHPVASAPNPTFQTLRCPARAAGEDHGCPNKLDNATTDAPVVRQAKRADLAVGFSIAIEQQEVGDPFIAARNWGGSPRLRRARFASTVCRGSRP